MRFSVLGPVRAWRGSDELRLGARQARLMLALLLVRSGNPVTSEDFATLLWGQEPPARAANIIHRHIGALRRLIEPGLPPRASGRWITLDGSGYRMNLEVPSSDLLRFRAHAAAAREAMATGDCETAIARYRSALRTWTGRCATGLDPDPEFVPEFAALDHERSLVACAAADAALNRGDVSELVPLMREAAEHNPFDEALQARLLLVLAADGKQAEAIAAFRAVRAGLAEQLGVDPGRELQAAFDRVLRHQAAVGAEPGPQTPAARPAETEPAAVPAQLPLSVRFFAGRASELGRLSALLPSPGEETAGAVTVAVDGLPGVGKTSLVVHWAHTVAGRFPDGQLFVDLRGFDGSEAMSTDRALMVFLAALAVPEAQIPPTTEARTTLYRTLTAGRRMLIVLDNARSAEQVRPLIPAAPGCFVVVTSRRRLTGLVAQEGAHHIALDPPSLEEARTVLRARLGANRDADDLVVLDEIIERCGRLPLAMAVVAARGAAYPECRLSELAAELRNSASLDVFNGDEPRSDVRTVFSWSYRQLGEAAAQLFRLLPLHPGPDFRLSTIASLAGVAREQARALVAELVRTRLLIEPRLHRYAFHDLIRRYAVELGDQRDGVTDRDQASARVLDHLRQTAYAASCLLMPQALLFAPPPAREGVTPDRLADADDAMAWFTAELPVLEAAIAETRPDFPTWQLAESLLPFYQRRDMYRSWATSAEAALRAARRAGDRHGQARMYRMLGGAKAFEGNRTSAIEHLQQALSLFADLGRTLEQAYVLSNLGWVWYHQGDLGQSHAHYRKALALFQVEGDQRGQAFSLLGIGNCLVRTAQFHQAEQVLRRAFTMLGELGDQNGEGSCATVLSDALDGLGRLDEAIEWRHRARHLFRRASNDSELADNERGLGDAYQRAGRPVEAVRAWQEARRIYVDLGSDEKVRMMTARIDRREVPGQRAAGQDALTR
ncbi:BTAD domain-containing putative transcriptional regulator [Micromonospora krabiensis]|nr:BTAD domain-containing putative transcriptional regulator [Micromonospora krabiensis]